MKRQNFIILMIIFLLSDFSYSQFKDYKVKGGAHYLMVSPSGEFVKDLSSFFIRGFVAVELGKYVDVEVGGGYMKWKQRDQYNGDQQGKVEAELIPLDLRLRVEPLAPKMKYVNPYLYVGAGFTKHELKKTPSFPTYSNPYDTTSDEVDRWDAFFPAGVGLEIKLSKQVLLDLQAGASTTLTDKINGNVIGDPK